MSCQDCRSPWCLKHNNFHREYHMIIEDIGEKHRMNNRSKQFLCYKVIIRAKFGELAKGERR